MACERGGGGGGAGGGGGEGALWRASVCCAFSKAPQARARACVHVRTTTRYARAHAHSPPVAPAADAGARPREGAPIACMSRRRAHEKRARARAEPIDRSTVVACSSHADARASLSPGRRCWCGFRCGDSSTAFFRCRSSGRRKTKGFWCAQRTVCMDRDANPMRDEARATVGGAPRSTRRAHTHPGGAQQRHATRAPSARTNAHESTPGT